MVFSGHDAQLSVSDDQLNLVQKVVKLCSSCDRVVKKRYQILIKFQEIYNEI